MSSITDNNVNEMLERRQTRSGTPLGGRSSVEKTTGSNQKRSSLRQRTRAQTGNEVSTITEVIETQTTEVVFTENSVTTDTVDIRSLKGRQKKSVSVERTKNAEGANSVAAATVMTVTHREPQLYKATRRLFDQKEEEKNESDEELLADSTTRESRAFDYSSYSSDDGSGKPLRAYDIYKRAGEYWNVFPKTDFTYSPTSEDRREIAPGVINIPNMSRRGIHQGRLRSPTRYHTVTTSSSAWTKHSTPRNIPASKLKFWSSLDSDEDEVDSEVRRRHRLYTPQQSSRLTTVKNFFMHYLATVWTVITTFYTGAVEKASQAFGYRSHSSAVHSRHIAAVSERSTFHSWIVYLFSKLWDVSSWIFTTEVWLATLWNAGDKEGESSSAVGLRSQKYRRLLWLMLIPFLMLAGIFLFQGNPISLPDFHVAVPGFIYELPSFFRETLYSLHVIPDFICSLPELIYLAALKVVEVLSEIPGFFLYRVPEFLFKVPGYLSLIPVAAYWLLEGLYKILGIFPHTFLLVKEAVLSLF